MSAPLGSSLDARSADPRLGELIMHTDARRNRSWRIQFMAMWLAIVAGLVLFVVLTVKVDADFINGWAPFILAGVPVTLFIAAASISLAIVLAAIGALGRLSSNPYFNGAASFYVSFFRGTPLLLQILFVFLGLPQAGIVLDPLPTAILALGFNYGAYMTEIFRAGIEAVPHGQVEAAHSLGMNGRTTFQRIVLPQAFRIVIPAIGNDFVAMLKDSSLVSVLTVMELTKQTQIFATNRGSWVVPGLLCAALYLAMSLPLGQLARRLEARWRAPTP